MKSQRSASIPKIIKRTADWVAVHKPSGWVTYGDPVEKSAQTWLKESLAAPVFPVHRLDRETCGILLFATSPAAAARATQMFAKREARKVYWALVEGKKLAPSGVSRESLKQPKTGEMQRATTHWRVLAEKEEGSVWRAWLELVPDTGRFHQLRRHLSRLGAPILGDPVYGSKKGATEGPGRTLLSAVELRWSGGHVTTQPDRDWGEWRNRLKLGSSK